MASKNFQESQKTGRQKHALGWFRSSKKRASKQASDEKFGRMDGSVNSRYARPSRWGPNQKKIYEGNCGGRKVKRNIKLRHIKCGYYLNPVSR